MTKPRIPEGKAITDTPEMTMEQYSKTMKKQLGKEYIRFAQNVINCFSSLRSSRVLEIGPGPGWAGINLLKKRNDFLLDGLEASSDMIRVATKNAGDEQLSERIKYMDGLAEEMKNIPDKYYDLVISRDSLHHWENPEKVFTQIERVLKQDGKVYIHDHRRNIGLFGKFIVNVIGHIFAGKMLKYWKSSINASYTKEEIEEILNKLKVENWEVKSNLLDLTIIKN